MAVRTLPELPGSIVAEGKRILLRDWIDHIIFDTVFLPAAIAGGRRDRYFVDLAGKDDLDTNIKTPRQLPKEELFVTQKLGYAVLPVRAQSLGGGVNQVPVADVERLIFSSTLELQIGEQPVWGPFPSHMAPSGFGVAGQTTETNASIVSNGVPSPVAVENLTFIAMITPNDNFEAIVIYPSAITIAQANTRAQVLLKGLKRRPVR